MGWIFSAFLLVSIIHMGEEYFYPGGFMDMMKRLNPKFAPLVTTPMAIIVNGLQLLLCVAAIVVDKNIPLFSMSIAGLLFINGLVHLMACVRVKGYAPGVVSGALLYVPLSVYAYYLFISSGELSLTGVIVTGVLGLLYQAVPIGYFVSASAIRRA
ncbi:MAG: HXXEE domain-containing protein [Anaerolineaceae bacterium]|nr:HXXEE domain-containing protein [Anaerolineaceae bacterium]